MTPPTRPIIFASVGYPKVGKETTITFLAEVLFEKGYGDFQSVNLNCNDYISRLQNIHSNIPVDKLRLLQCGLPLIIPGQKIYPIVFISRINTLDQFNFLKEFPGFIPMRVTNCNSEYNPEFSWINTVSCPAQISNDNNMQRLKFTVKDHFESHITNLKIWKESF